MEKSAIGSVAWCAQTEGYQLREQVNQGIVATSMNDESAAWNAWLEREPSFAFQGRDGCHLTVLKEHRGQGRAYWTAYRSVGGKLKRKYLGASTKITLARLEEAATALSEGKAATASGTSPHPRPLPGSSAPVERDQERTPWQASFVATKFFVPTPSHALISRPRLTDLLNQGFTQKLTLVSAPAGFGKTTLVAAWVRALAKDASEKHAQLAWVSLDGRDNDPIRFWSALLTALDQRAPGYFRQALALLQAQSSPELESVLTILINRLAEATTPWVLLLDDYHVISEQTVHAQLSFLLERQPPNVHLLLLSRSNPPLPLPRLRAQGEVLEVGAEELRATVEETAAYLSDVMGIQLPRAAVSELTARTEGWLVGLQLVGLSLRRSADPAAMLEEVRGSLRYILDYLVEEVLQQQPPSVQRFLLRTSILDQLCASLCDAVVGKPRGQAGSRQVLQELERANVFVVPLDEHRKWYRYHALFAEALRYQLEQQHADELAALHLRASSWYAERGDTFQAVQHALQARTWLVAADLIEQVPNWLMWNEGQREALTLRQWLHALPADVVRARPRLCLLYAQALYFAAPRATVESWLQAAEAALAASSAETAPASAEREELENLRGEIAAFRAVLAIFQFGDAQAGLALGQRALSLFSPQSLAARADVLLVQATAHFADGEMGAASQSALEAERLAQATGNIPGAIISLSVAARCLLVAGHLHEAWRVLERAVRLGSELEWDLSLRMDQVYALQAEILREWNQLDEALALTTEAIQRAERLGTPTTLLAVYAALARIELSRGDPEAARAALERGDDVKRRLDSKQLFSFISSFHTIVTQMKLWLVQGELAHASRWAGELLRNGGSSAATGREREEVALIRLLLAQDRPTEARTRLMPLLERATRQERWWHVIELRLLQAKTRLHEEQEALACLSHAVQLAEPEGYVRIFVDEGPRLEMLLRRLREQEHKEGPTPYLDTLLAAFPPRERAEQHSWSPLQQGVLDPLSQRELEVLGQLSRGASNYEIAQALVITVETVKRHVGNILGKLRVNNRTQAGARARMLGLLADESP